MSLTALLRCHDVRTTRVFYRETLGFEVSDTAEGTITARLDDGELIFTQNDLWKTVPAVSGTLYFTVADVNSYFESVRAKAQITWPLQNMPYGSREFGVRDCNGYGLAFQQRTAVRRHGLQDPLVVEDSDLKDSRFENVNLERTQIRNANLRRVNLTDVALEDATFTDCNFAGACIRQSNTSGLQIDNVLVSDLQRIYRQSTGTNPSTALSCTDLARPFLPSQDFELSKRFYEALGFEKLLDGDVAIFGMGSSNFILHRHYQKDLAENFMMQLMVDDVDAWWSRIHALNLPGNFGVRPPRAPEIQSWGLRVAFVFDPCGVLWHVAQRRAGRPQD